MNCDSEGIRRFEIRPPLGADKRRPFCSNEVTTSKYKVWNFIFLNLIEQFSKIANIYFLVLGCLQMWKTVSTSGGLPTLFLPLSFVILSNAVKDAIEDIARHKADKKENSQITHIIDRDFNSKALSRASSDQFDSCLRDCVWRDVNVGEIIIVKNREAFPADLILLATSDPFGLAYIETANLDGETNLKLRQTDSRLQEYFSNEKEAAWRKGCELNGHVNCQEPNKILSVFEGTITIPGACNNSAIPITPTQVLLRGCKLRNTQWVLGVACYSGAQTKIQMNSISVTSKLSTIEKLTSRLTIIIFAIQMTLCLIAAILSYQAAKNSSKYTYLDFGPNDSASDNWFVAIFLKTLTFLLLFTNFIPISLIVTVSVVKTAQGFFINADDHMYHATTDTNAVVRNSGLNDELGLIEYIFSDKTGTLTCNVMEFRKFCVNGTMYGEGITEIRKGVLKKLGHKIPDDPIPDPSDPITSNVNIVDKNIRLHLNDPAHPNYTALRDFFMHLAINHAIMPEIQEPEYPGAEPGLVYSASSPDEGALTYGARHFGITFRDRDPEGVNVIVDGVDVRVETLVSIEFTSSRKRSSTVAKYVDPVTKQEKIILFCKGADTIIQQRLDPKHPGNTRIDRTFAAMESFADDGLRTLCIASRAIPSAEFAEWKVKWDEACSSMDNRASKMEAVSEELEKDLVLDGCTGIEDKLQDGVGETIEKLAEAGIKIWMLTGDKMETAINISIATSLLTLDMHRIVLNVADLNPGETVMDKIQSALKTFKGAVAKSSKAAKKRQISLSANQFENLIDGINNKDGSEDDLGSIIEMTGLDVEAFRGLDGDLRLALIAEAGALLEALKPENEAAFVELADMCKIVVCCRVSPEQKGSIVRAVKKQIGAVTLAIGDGANDCNMIQAADVGVGLRGEEGLQAFNVSDYGLSQFKFLQTLLLVHGRWCYRRISKIVFYSFYKNIVLVVPQLMFAAFSLYSGQKLYTEILYQCYNVLFANWPLCMFGSIDQDVSRKSSLKYPQLYKLGNRHRVYSTDGIMIKWIINAFFHSAIIFAIPMTCLSGWVTSNSTDRIGNDLWIIGQVMYLILVFVVNFKIYFETYSMNRMTHISVLISIMSFIVIFIAASGVPDLIPEMHYVAFRTFSSPVILLTVCLTISATLCRDFVFKGFKRSFIPELYHVIQKRECFVLKLKKDVLANLTKQEEEIANLRSQEYAEKKLFTENNNSLDLPVDDEDASSIGYTIGIDMPKHVSSEEHYSRNTRTAARMLPQSVNKPLIPVDSHFPASVRMSSVNSSTSSPGVSPNSTSRNVKLAPIPESSFADDDHDDGVKKNNDLDMPLLPAAVSKPPPPSATRRGAVRVPVRQVPGAVPQPRMSVFHKYGSKRNEKHDEDDDNVEEMLQSSVPPLVDMHLAPSSKSNMMKNLFHRASIHNAAAPTALSQLRSELMEAYRTRQAEEDALNSDPTSTAVPTTARRHQNNSSMLVPQLNLNGTGTSKVDSTQRGFAYDAPDTSRAINNPVMQRSYMIQPDEDTSKAITQARLSFVNFDGSVPAPTIDKVSRQHRFSVAFKESPAFPLPKTSAALESNDSNVVNLNTKAKNERGKSILKKQPGPDENLTFPNENEKKNEQPAIQHENKTQQNNNIILTSTPSQEDEKITEMKDKDKYLRNEFEEDLNLGNASNGEKSGRPSRKYKSKKEFSKK